MGSDRQQLQRRRHPQTRCLTTGVAYGNTRQVTLFEVMFFIRLIEGNVANRLSIITVVSYAWSMMTMCITLHGYRDTRPQIYCCQELELLGSLGILTESVTWPLGSPTPNTLSSSQTRSGFDAGLLRYIHLSLWTPFPSILSSYHRFA